MAWRACLIGLTILLLATATTAPAFQCPAPDQLVRQGGAWTAPGGWTQSDYAHPTPGAKINRFLAATYTIMMDSATLTCNYTVENQPGVLYAQVQNSAPAVPLETVAQCSQHLPGFSCPGSGVTYPCAGSGGVSHCQVLP